MRIGLSLVTSFPRQYIIQFSHIPASSWKFNSNFKLVICNLCLSIPHTTILKLSSTTAMYNVDSQMKTKLLCSSWYHWIHFKQKTAVTNTVIAGDWIFHSFTTAFKRIIPFRSHCFSPTFTRRATVTLRLWKMPQVFSYTFSLSLPNGHPRMFGSREQLVWPTVLTLANESAEVPQSAR